MTTTPKTIASSPSIETLSARIAALEGENKKLRQAPPAAPPVPQGIDTHRKNLDTDTLVQRTMKGNIRVTHDPSPEFVLEAGAYGNVSEKDAS